jgi:hypothetical protein
MARSHLGLVGDRELLKLTQIDTISIATPLPECQRRISTYFLSQKKGKASGVFS